LAGASLFKAEEFQEKNRALGQVKGSDAEGDEESESWEEYNEDDSDEAEEDDPWAPAKFDEEE